MNKDYSFNKITESANEKNINRAKLFSSIYEVVASPESATHTYCGASTMVYPCVVPLNNHPHSCWLRLKQYDDSNPTTTDQS